MPQDEHITFRGARLLFRNFAGKETKYNRKGNRNFCVVIPEDLVEVLRKDDWNVKMLPPREDGDPLYYMKVSINFEGRRPPKIVLVTSRGRTDIDQELVGLLDGIDTLNVDLIVRPYNWTVKGESGVSAYLKTMFLTMREDELELEYADVPEIGGGGQLAIGSREDFIEGEVVD